MGNEPPGGPFDLLKLAFGEVPGPWIRFAAFGALIMWAVFAVRDFRNDVRNESQAVRQALGEYIAANKAWQDTSMDERKYLLSRVNVRFQRIYKRNGWEYEPIEVPR